MKHTAKLYQYWSLIVVTAAIALSIPLTGDLADRRTGLEGLLGPSPEINALNGLEGQMKIGYSRPADLPPLYGFDGISLQTPLFKSWWDGKAAVAKLLELGINTVVIGQAWQDAQLYSSAIARLHDAGIRVITQVTNVADWVETIDDGTHQPHFVPGTFNETRALHALAQAHSQGIERFADFLILAGTDHMSALSFANQEQRQKMYQLAKQYFPNTPILQRYGADLERAEAIGQGAHPMGGRWDAYRFGGGECDLALINVGRGLSEGRMGVNVSTALERLNHAISIVKSRQPEVGIVVLAELAEERFLSSTKTAMWSVNEINQYVSAMLASEAVDGLLFKGLGSFAFDFGHPSFEAQRLALRKAGPGASSAAQRSDDGLMTPATHRSPANR